MKLIFSDEFDYEGKPDPTKWTHETGGNWHNDEIQYYTDHLENAYVKDGKLSLVARNEKMGTRDHTSARLTTYGNFSFKYGKIEMSAKLPAGKGSWPAFWMLPDAIKEGVNWPLCGEIDIMEYAAGVDAKLMHVSLHSELYNHSKDTQETHVEPLEGLCDGFHKYSCEWNEDSIAFSFDDQVLATFYRDKRANGEVKDPSEEGWPFNQNFHLLINLAVGGFFGGEVDASHLPYVFEIEYVRVYQG